MNTSFSDEESWITVIEPGRAERNYWADLWRYRELFLILAWRDVAVRYKQTAIGISWAFIRPVLTMVIFTIVFHRIAKLPTTGDVPYALLVFAAILPWHIFSASLNDASNSLIDNANLIGKVYFPRIIIPAASVVATFVEVLIGLGLLAMLMLYYGISPTINLFALPALLMLVALASLGPSLLLAALNAKYRDFRYVVPFITQVGLYVSPVGFSSDLVDDRWRLLYSLNPMAGLIDAFRWCILGESSLIHWPGFILGMCVIALLLVTGIHHFRKTEKTFADIL